MANGSGGALLNTIESGAAAGRSLPSEFALPGNAVFRTIPGTSPETTGQAVGNQSVDPSLNHAPWTEMGNPDLADGVGRSLLDTRMALGAQAMNSIHDSIFNNLDAFGYSYLDSLLDSNDLAAQRSQ